MVNLFLPNICLIPKSQIVQGTYIAISTKKRTPPTMTTKGMQKVEVMQGMTKQKLGLKRSSAEESTRRPSRRTFRIFSRRSGMALLPHQLRSTDQRSLNWLRNGPPTRNCGRHNPWTRFGSTLGRRLDSTICGSNTTPSVCLSRACLGFFRSCMASQHSPWTQGRGNGGRMWQSSVTTSASCAGCAQSVKRGS